MIEFTDEIRVELVKTDFSDEWPCYAAWTSTRGGEATTDVKSGLINRLISDRHGSPFEHMNATWRVTAPIFVWREHHRHRMASYNEESGRYKKLDPIFYVPSKVRPLYQVQGSKQMDYKLECGDPKKYEEGFLWHFYDACGRAYEHYDIMLGVGVAREVARMVLPVSIMSTCIVTMNARALMNFLSLRVRDDKAAYPSKPMLEIQMVAEQYEATFREYAPITHGAFVRNGRVAP